MDTIVKSGDQPQPGRSPLEDEIVEWGEKFKALAEEAANAGFTSAVILVAFDPIDRSTWRSAGFTGNFYEAIGAAELTLHEWKHGE